MEELKSFIRNAIEEEFEEDLVIESLVDVHGARKLEDLQEIDFKLIPSLPGLKTVQYSRFKKAVNLKFYMKQPSTPSSAPPPTPPSTRSPASSEATTLMTPMHPLANFAVPFHRFPASLKKVVSEKRRQTDQDKKTLVNFLFDEIYTIEKKPGKPFLTRAAMEVVQKYPQSFREELENGQPIGTGCNKLIRKLEFKFHNANRTNKNNLFPNDGNGTRSRKRIIPKDRYGCVNFLPTGLPANETPNTQQEKKSWLIQEFLKVHSERDSRTIKQYMKDTYVYQRQIITQKETVTSIRKEWPFLFEVRVCTHMKL